MRNEMKIAVAITVAVITTAGAYYHPAEIFMIVILMISPGIPLIILGLVIYYLFFKKDDFVMIHE